MVKLGKVWVFWFVVWNVDCGNFDACIETSNFLSACWMRFDDMRLCMNDAVTLMNLRCSEKATRKYIHHQVRVMNLTRNVLDSILAESPKNCLRRLLTVAVNQGLYIIDGYTAPDGCRYRKLLGSLAAEIEDESSECAPLIENLENSLLIASNCKNFSSSTNEIRNEEIQSTLITCSEINAQIGNCFKSHLQCTDTFSKMIKCFKDATLDIAKCGQELIQRTLKTSAKTSLESIKYFCSDKLTMATRSLCENYFWKITSFASKIIPNFHTPENCRDKKIFFDHVVSTTTNVCKDIVTNFTRHILGKSSCSGMMSNSSEIFDSAIKITIGFSVIFIYFIINN